MINTSHAAIFIIVTAALSGCSTTGDLNELPLDSATSAALADNNEFTRRVYAAVSAGASHLKPNTSDATNVSVNDNVAGAGQATIGADVSRNLSVEIHSADLGSAGLDPTGRVGYQIDGGSVLWYAGQQHKNRKGLLGYGRVGVGKTENTPIGNVRLQTFDDPQALFGAGVEYMGRNLGVRGELIVFDSDAQLAQLGLIYRLGQTNATREKITDYTEESETPEIADPLTTDAAALTDAAAEPESAEPLITASIEPVDADNDGIPDSLDNCLESETDIQVDDSGCAIFNGVIDGVNFSRGSAILTVEAQRTLDNVAKVLRQYPEAYIAIAAHTDDIGRDRDNLSLSRERAISVAAYLITRGISKASMSARAFGEYQPISENDTPEGRALNRRVEIVAGKTRPAS